ncbi:MAG: hypothetical protein ABI467_25210 [Kofleriaceae bacterium]
MPVIARDAVASDHLVYAWPFPIGPEEHEVVCADDEQVVMCPAWLVGGLLQTGRHRWRTPDPMRPVSAFFVLTAPVEVSFDMVTMFLLPPTGQGVRLRAIGSLQVRCTDPSLLIAQFVGLPFDAVNDGILRSVSRSIERMLARLLTRRVVMAGTPNAVTDQQMHPHIIEELVAYNPAAGAVFGVELVRMGHLVVLADDGTRPLAELAPSLEWSGHHRLGPNGDTAKAPALEPPLTETIRSPGGGRTLAATTPPPLAPIIVEPPDLPPLRPVRASSQPSQQASGEINVRPRSSAPTPPLPLPLPPPAPKIADGTPIPPRSKSVASGEVIAGTPTPRLMPSVPPPASARQRVTEASGLVGKPNPASRSSGADSPGPATEDITQPGVPTPVPGAMRIGAVEAEQPRGAIMGIGVSHIASSQVTSGEIPQKVSPGARVLVPGPNGLMQSATVRQLLQGYYELEVGASGETIWVPINGVVPHE